MTEPTIDADNRVYVEQPPAEPAPHPGGDPWAHWADDPDAEPGDGLALAFAAWLEYRDLPPTTTLRELIEHEREVAGLEAVRTASPPAPVRRVLDAAREWRASCHDDPALWADEADVELIAAVDAHDGEDLPAYVEGKDCAFWLAGGEEQHRRDCPVHGEGQADLAPPTDAPSEPAPDLEAAAAAFVAGLGCVLTEDTDMEAWLALPDCVPCGGTGKDAAATEAFAAARQKPDQHGHAPEAAAGRLADPQQQERLAKAERDLAQIRADWWTVSAERDRNMDRAHAEIERLRARVAELEQTLHEIANLAATTPVDEPRVAIDNLGEIVRRARQEQPGRWELPAEPGPEVRCVRTDDRRHWARTIGGDLWVHPPGGPIRWEALLALSAATVCNCIPANPTTEHGCDDCSVEPGETHRWPGCPGAVRARQRMATPPETAGGGDDA